MVWVIIIVLLVIAFGPILWLRPSRRERRLAKMRQQARLLGLEVGLQQLPDNNAAAIDRVTAGGVVKSPQIQAVAYSLPYRHGLEAPLHWCVRRSSSTGAPGWRWDDEGRGERSPELRDRISPLLAQLPDDALQLGADERRVSCVWQERVSAEAAQATVGRLFEILRQAVEIQEEIDANRNQPTD